MKRLQKQLKLALFREQKKLEEMEAFYHCQEILAREIMCRAQDKLAEIEQEKNRLTLNTKDIEAIKSPSFYQRPFLFSEDK